jgi:serine/tyrosine/threonine adenylyltransferase
VLSQLALAPTTPQLQQHVPLLEQQLSKWSKFHELFEDMSPATKAASDTAAWRSWLESYAVRLEKEPRSTEAARQEAMRTSNPRFVLRNYLAQVAIRAAEEGDFTEARQLLQRVTDPYGLDDSVPAALTDVGLDVQRSGKVKGGNLLEFASDSVVASRYDATPPGWACKLRVSCSS